MTKPTGKKRGRPPKLSEWTIRFGEDQAKWNKHLRSLGLPEEKRSEIEILACDLFPFKDDDGGPDRERFTGDSEDHRSFTQQTDPVLSGLREAAADESIDLSADWRGYLEYIGVVAEYISRKDDGAALKSLALEDARSRHSERPTEFPAELGTPTEFRDRLFGHEMELRYTVNRKETTMCIHVYQLPPDEDEDLDPAGAPVGHWEGLTWFPYPAE